MIDRRRSVEGEEHLCEWDAVVEHIRSHRDDLRGALLAFSGGKDSVLLARAVLDAVGELPELLYVHGQDCEWPCHTAWATEWAARHGASVRNEPSGVCLAWHRERPWSVLPSSAASAERFARAHHRGTARRIARAEGSVLLWGNRRADGNTVRGSRQVDRRGTRLWMPVYRLPNDELRRLAPADWSPVYGLPSMGASGLITGRIRRGDEQRRERVRDVREHAPNAAAAFERLVEGQPWR